MINSDLMIESGWELVEVGDNGPATPKEFRNRFEKWLLVSERYLSHPHHVIFHDRCTDAWKMNGRLITDIPQLTAGQR